MYLCGYQNRLPCGVVHRLGLAAMYLCGYQNAPVQFPLETQGLAAMYLCGYQNTVWKVIPLAVGLAAMYLCGYLIEIAALSAARPPSERQAKVKCSLKLTKIIKKFIFKKPLEFFL